MVYRQYGGPEVLELAELPAPKTHVDSVLVRVRAAALNPADLALQAGALDGAVDTYFPVIPGWDIAGVVERSGLATPEFAPGDEVIGYIRGEVQRAHGGMAELVSTDARNLVRKPRALSFAEAARPPAGGADRLPGRRPRPGRSAGRDRAGARGGRRGGLPRRPDRAGPRRTGHRHRRRAGALLRARPRCRTGQLWRGRGRPRPGNSPRAARTWSSTPWAACSRRRRVRPAWVHA